MKKYILPLMSIALLMAMASCSSSDDEVAENKVESKLVPMTFTATQESNAGTRTVLNNKNVDWQTGDAISVFDGTNAENNRKFTIKEFEASSGVFSGSALSNVSEYYAVYPYTSGAQLNSDGSVSGIELPSNQTATLNSFDPKAALMMAKTTDKSNLKFYNAVSLVKIQTEFDCKKIVLSADVPIAGTGKLEYNTDEPSISFESGQSNTITLNPASGSTEFVAGTYYIVVPPTTLTNGFSISFTASDDKVYTRKSTKSNTFNRSKIKDFGSFATTGDYWYDASRGDKVRADQEVDMGLTVDIDGVNYKVIFAKTNLTAIGLAENASDYGDYFAWGATEPWYTSINNSNPDFNNWSFTRKEGKTGYDSSSCPSYNNSDYADSNNVLKMDYDPAREILGGSWQLPTTEIWDALYKANKITVNWGNNGDKEFVNGEKGIKITKIGDPTTYLFLPAAGDVDGTSFNRVGSNGYYWSGTANSSTRAYGLFFYSGNVNAQNQYLYRYLGLSVRPVRLVAVN